MALFSIFIHLSIANNLEYHRDELLYFSLGMHPAAGYASVPPLTGWIAWLMQNIFGYSVFAVRIYPALLSGAIDIPGCFNGQGAWRIKVCLLSFSLGLLISICFMRTFMIVSACLIEIFLWTLAIYMIIKYINTQNDKFLILFGIIAGLALLNKYLAGMLFIGLAGHYSLYPIPRCSDEENVLGRYCSRIPDLSS